MGQSYAISHRHNVVVFFVWDHVTVAESLGSLEAYFSDPDARPGHRHLIDCSAITSYEQNPTGMMKLQARVADDVTPDQPQTLLVIHAPPGLPQEFASAIARSWSHIPHVVVRIANTEQAAIDMLGLAVGGLAEVAEPPWAAARTSR